MDGENAAANPIIREPKAGDMGHIISRHGILYNKEYDFDSTFENYVLLGLARYIENYDSTLDSIWVADFNGCPVGYIAIMHISTDTAQLRWFLIEPEFRNIGLGKNLIRVAIEFCKPRYKNIFLWTLSSLDSARHLYKSFGFKFVEEDSHLLWGKHLTEEKWDLKL